MKRGMTGTTLQFIIGIILGVFALIIVWLFLTGNITLISRLGDSAIKGFTCFVCDKAGWIGNVFGCGGCK